MSVNGWFLYISKTKIILIYKLHYPYAKTKKIIAIL